MRSYLTNVNKIAIKAGTSILSSKKSGRILPSHIERLALQVSLVAKAKKKVVLVSSGSIAYGMQVLKLKKRPTVMSKLQACASIGQGKLVQAYESFFSKRGLHAAQILLTRDGLEHRQRFLSARNTLEELLSMGVVPVVNENDTVATEEIAFGDNDVLSVQTAHLMNADLLIILSDVDGFFLKDGSRVREVSSEDEIDKELMKHIKDKKKEQTVGGMRAKLEAARTAMRLGVPLLIVDGHDKNVIGKALAGEDVGTLFYSKGTKKNARKKWIAYSAARKGSLTLDAGALKAISGGKRSLLPSGIKSLKGNFAEGHVVELQNDKGEVFGRGVTKYSSGDLAKIIGKKTSQIQSILGYSNKDEVVHRNDLILWR